MGYLADDESRDSYESGASSDFSNPRTPAEEVENQLIELNYLIDNFLWKRRDFYRYPSYRRKIKREIKRRLRIRRDEMACRAQEEEACVTKPFSSPILDVIASIMSKLQRYEFRIHV